MNPLETGRKYDKIAVWWQEQHQNSEYGLKSFERALKFVVNKNTCLDVGCGSGGRFLCKLESEKFYITGIDVSEKMIELAKTNHPGQNFINDDICKWNSKDKYDFIFAWDSIFHLPLDSHEKVISKLCDYLNKDGILLYTFGNAEGEHTDTWHQDQFYYSSIGISKNIQLIIENGLVPLHLEVDQFPERHVVLIGKKL